MGRGILRWLLGVRHRVAEPDFCSDHNHQVRAFSLIFRYDPRGLIIGSEQPCRTTNLDN